MLLLVRFFILAIALAAVAISPLHAAECTIPNAFTAGTPAVAVEVNANFASVASAVDDNDGRIEALVARIVSMRRQITAIQDRHAQLQSENAALLSRLAAVQGNAVLDLDGVLTRESDTLAPVLRRQRADRQRHWRHRRRSQRCRQSDCRLQ